MKRERRLQELDEKHFVEIDVAMLDIEEALKRAERAAAVLRADSAEQHLIGALERSEEELPDVARRLRQGTFFARRLREFAAAWGGYAGTECSEAPH